MVLVREGILYSNSSYAHLDSSSNDIEIMWTEIIRSGKINIVLVNLYRPPDGNKAFFIESLNSKIELANLRRKDLIIMGDFNYDYLDVGKVSTKLMKIRINL